MNIRPQKTLLLPLLALALTFAMAASARAEVSLQVSIGSAPHWVGVQGTRVQVIREGEGPGYDMFRYGRYYYVYDNDQWYRSRRWNGRFVSVDERYLPSEFRRVPRNHWHNYPSAWDRGRDRGPGGSSSYLQVNFGRSPRWSGIHGTRVEEIPMAQRPGYDVFRYGGSYYAYNNNRWYSSRRGTGNFTAIDDRSVPGELSRVPRDHWRNYPSAWTGPSDQGPGGTSAYLEVNLGPSHRWSGVQGTRVEEIPMAERPGYDVFRYGGSYYAYNNNRWYSSNSESGRFVSIDDRAIPSELSRVPRDHWRSYPTAWQNQDQTQPRQDQQYQDQNQNQGPPGQERKNRDHRSNGNGR